jgi:16S rRNA (guanine527-N7)-methyltransferase
MLVHDTGKEVGLRMEQFVTGAKVLGASLNADQLGSFALYYRALIEWNARVNLTALTKYDDVLTKHFLDSLTCLLAMEERLPGQRLLDVGSGAGFPGLVLQIACPEMSVTLLEATRKKTDFLRDITSRLGLTQVRIVNARAEEIGHDPQHREAYDWVVARAVADLAELAEYLLPFCRLGHSCIALKAGETASEIEGAARAIETLGGKLRQVIPVQVHGLRELRRQVLEIAKVRPTPPAYPRRSGLPHKRPIR